LYSEIK